MTLLSSFDFADFSFPPLSLLDFPPPNELAGNAGKQNVQTACERGDENAGEVP